MITEDQLWRKAQQLLERCRQQDAMVATAESCTGGLVAGFLTEVPGSSDVVERGFVTYSNDAKAEMLGVPVDMIMVNGAVSEPVVRAMAEGAIGRSRATLAVAITGVAGPGGGSAAKPVGLVHFASARKGGSTIHLEKRFGDIGRRRVRLESVAVAFRMLNDLLT